MLALLVVQVAGLHCHVKQPAGPRKSEAAVHVQHFGTSGACHEDACERDLSIPGFWKSAGQSWNMLALLAVTFVFLLPLLGRSTVVPEIAERLFYHHQIFLRPPLRAPPR